jgi:hypothetical protein
MSDMDRMLELRKQGFYCSQILMIMALDLQGRDNPALVRSMEALAGGLGFTGETCGTLTAAAAVLGLYAGRGREAEDDDPTLVFMIEDLVKWFKEGYGQEYGGIACREILATDPNSQLTRCPGMIAGTFQKIKELLVENGFDLSGKPDDDD